MDDVTDELCCAICMEIYRDPVTLPCGHNFCQECITQSWDYQVHLREYKCPDCQKIYRKRPELVRNTTLRNAADAFYVMETDPEQTGVYCDYCDFPVAATKSCLQCETSLCDHHLTKHDRLGEHTLLPPTIDVGKSKCPIHKMILQYYCTEHAVCMCVCCKLVKEHLGHQVVKLDEAFENRKKLLTSNLQKLIAEAEVTEKRDQSLGECRRKAQEKAERVTALFINLRRRLEDLEKRVLSDISRQVQLYDDTIRKLEIKKEELSRKMRHIEELCNMTDPLTVLRESNTGDLCDTEDIHDKQLHDGGDLDVAGISYTLQTGLSDIMSGVHVCLYMQETEDIFLDVNTAGNTVQIFADKKTASKLDESQYLPETPDRFQYPQVLSSQRFSSWRHYWEVDVEGSDAWRVGMCYPSIARRGAQSVIGDNNKSWCLYRWGNHYSVVHNWEDLQLPDKIPSNRIGIYLDYEAGQISFYDMCGPIRHLHTFTATFTEPLHAALWVGRGLLKISRRNWM